MSTKRSLPLFRKARLSPVSLLVGFVCSFMILRTQTSSAFNGPCRTIKVKSKHHELSSMLVEALRNSLDTLQPYTIPLSHDRQYYRVLSAAKVGIEWNSVPEKFWQDMVLPRLHGHVNIVDIGANEGQFALPNGRHGHHVISFEPNLQTCESLKRSVSSERLRDKVCCFHSKIHFLVIRID